jgi:hypothetical protein
LEYKKIYIRASFNLSFLFCETLPSFYSIPPRNYTIIFKSYNGNEMASGRGHPAVWFHPKPPCLEFLCEYVPSGAIAKNHFIHSDRRLDSAQLFVKNKGGMP